MNRMSTIVSSVSRRNGFKQHAALLALLTLATGTFSGRACSAERVDAATVLEPGTPISNPLPKAIEPGTISVRLTPVADGFVAPLTAAGAPNDSGHLYVGDQDGQLWKLTLATGAKSLFADLRPLLVNIGVAGPGTYDERGLLGFAFHPDYSTNGLIYTFTSEPGAPTNDTNLPRVRKSAILNHRGVVREWRVPTPLAGDATVDPGSSRVVISVDEPEFNHNGGALAFGPDRLLYITTGDGGDDDDQGPGHSPNGNAQNLRSPLGKILRINPRARAAGKSQYRIPAGNPFAVKGQGVLSGGRLGCRDGLCDEIYAYGFRNPYRLAFDGNVLYVADVGEASLEEVNVVVKGGNYGWRRKEGSFCFRPAPGTVRGSVVAGNVCGSNALIDPVAQYDHDEGSAIIGGSVYRGQLIPALQGRYVFGDYARTGQADGRLFYLTRRNISRPARTSPIAELQLTDRPQLGLALLGLGTDTSGELYVLANATGMATGGTGVVLKISPP